MLICKTTFFRVFFLTIYFRMILKLDPLLSTIFFIKIVSQPNKENFWKIYKFKIFPGNAKIETIKSGVGKSFGNIHPIQVKGLNLLNTV